MMWSHRTHKRRGDTGKYIAGRVLLLFVCLSYVVAADWPLFRGDIGQTGLLKTELATNYELAWTYRTERMCSSAVVSQNIAVVGSGDGKVHAVNVADGKGRWTYDMGAEIEAAPIIHNEQVIIGSTEGKLVSLALADGMKKWEATAGDKITGAATVYSSGDKTVVLVGSYDNNVYCFDAADGKQLWAYETGSYINGTAAITMVDNKAVAIVGGCDAKLHVIGIADGKIVREIEVSAYVASSLACVDGHAYTGHYGNEVIDADLATGEIKWVYKQKNFPFFSSPAISSELIILGGRDRRVHCIDRKTGQAKWTFATRGNVDGSPVIGGNYTMIGSDDGRLYIIDITTGKDVWSYEIGDKISSSPAVVGDYVLVGCQDGGLYAFKKPAKEIK